ncbi:MAG: DUF6352 family protein [Rhodospirillales bacterium]
MADLWLTSGYELLDRNADGYLVATDDFVRAYLARPELAPVDGESCEAERALHARLLENPWEDVPDSEIDGLADTDVRENYRVMMTFRDRLSAAPTVEQCYLDLFAKGGAVKMPILFIDHLAHVVARNIFTADDDPFELRAAELLFREQTVTNVQGAILLADADTVELRQSRQDSGSFSLIELATDQSAAQAVVELDVLSEDNTGDYLRRSDQFDMALDVTFPRRGLDAVCRVLERWIRHFLKRDVRISPRQEIADEHWTWHVGLDVTSTSILNDLYQGREVTAERLEALISLFALEFRDGDRSSGAAQSPVYLAISRGDDKKLRMKPQNLLVNLPPMAAA